MLTWVSEKGAGYHVTQESALNGKFAAWVRGQYLECFVFEFMAIKAVEQFIERETKV